MDMKYGRPQLSLVQNERGQEEAKVISQESHVTLKAGRAHERPLWHDPGSICARSFHSRSSQSIKVPQQAKAPHLHPTSPGGTERPVASKPCLAHVGNETLTLPPHDWVCRWEPQICQFDPVWAFCDLVSVKVISLYDAHVDEAKRWISLCNCSNPFSPNGYKGTGST